MEVRSRGPLKSFKGIDFHDSFVLSWKHADSVLVFNVELSIWPESEYYLDPKPNEYTCYRKSSITFSDVESVRGLLPMNAVKEIVDLEGSVDYGGIDSLEKTADGFLISGEFGNVTIAGGKLSLVVE